MYTSQSYFSFCSPKMYNLNSFYCENSSPLINTIFTIRILSTEDKEFITTEDGSYLQEETS